MRTHSTLSWAFAVLAALLLVPALVFRPASAAHLDVTAAPIQTWKITDGMPDIPLPPVDLSACGDLDDYDELVTGTADDDELEAGNGRQILVGLAGNDNISGGNHDDCLLGGAGDDVLAGGNGKDVLVGGRGADELDGGNGKDVLDAGGDPGDSCVEGNGTDELVGCEQPEALTSDLPAVTDDVAGTGDQSGDQPGNQSGNQSGKPAGESTGSKGDPSPGDGQGGHQPQAPGAPGAASGGAEPMPDPPVEQDPVASADETQVTVP